MNSFLVFGLVAMTAGCDIHLPASAEAALEEMAGEASVEEVLEAALDAVEDGPDSCVHGEVAHRDGELCGCIGGQWDCMVPPAEDDASESQSSPVTVSDCSIACDAVEACAAEASEECFAVCLTESANEAVRASVHCVLEAQSCGQVVECAGPLSASPSPAEDVACEFGHQVMHDDGTVCACNDQGQWDCGTESHNEPNNEPSNEPNNEPSNEPNDAPGASVENTFCWELCNPVETCGFLPAGHCDEVCGPDVEIAADLVDCLQESTHCEEIFFCMEEAQQQAQQQAEEPVDAEVDAADECFPGEVSEEGCFCDQDHVWICDEQETAGDMEADCDLICEKMAECNNIPHQMCVPLCVSQFGTTGMDDCFLKANSCDELDACSNPDVNEDAPECEPGEVDGEGCFCKQDGHWTCGSPEVGSECSPEFPCEDMGNESDEEYEFEGQGDDDFQVDEQDEDKVDPCQEEGMDCTGVELDPTDSVGCSDVDIDRELMITDLSVVEDPERTFDGCVGNPTGAWAFGSLMTHMAGDNDPAEFTLNWLEQWTMDQELNGFVSPARLSIEEQVIQPWMARSGGESLDMEKAPFRLLAIVNRLDLRKTDVDGDFHAGEGRFVFGLVDVEAGCMPLEFVVIFEYGQPADSVAQIQDWAHAWHGLSASDFGPDYNASLEVVTTAFAGPGADASKPNGSSINQIRTNEIALDGPWELREFRVQPEGQLAQVSVKQEPGDAMKNSPELAEWINDNEADVLASTHVVPAEMLGPAAPVTGLWAPVGVDNPDARHSFALNTCSGCHQAETGAPFLHVGSRFPGEETPLSAFLVGGETMDPVSGAIRSFNDLERRMFDLCELVDEETTDEAVHDVDVAPACSAD